MMDKNIVFLNGQYMDIDNAKVSVLDRDHGAGEPVFNRVVTLRDSWAKIEKQALAKT